MRPARQLFELQQVDSQIAQVERALAGLDDGSRLRALVDAARGEEEAAAVSHKAAQARMRVLELELQSAVEKARKLEQDLYSGRVGNPKELTAMQEDLAALDRQRRRIEDELLGLMEETEELVTRIRTLEAQRQARERELEEFLADHQVRTRTLTAQLEALREAREAKAAAVDPELLRRYERLRPRKDGVAVAEVVRGVCSGCHVAIPEGRVAEIQDGERLFTCEECGRILYVPNG